jgi:hypothetical protein
MSNSRIEPQPYGGFPTGIKQIPTRPKRWNDR